MNTASKIINHRQALLPSQRVAALPMASSLASMPASRIQPSTLSVAARACGERNTRVRPPGSSECCASDSQRARILSADSIAPIL